MAADYVHADWRHFYHCLCGGEGYPDVNYMPLLRWDVWRWSARRCAWCAGRCIRQQLSRRGNLAICLDRVYGSVHRSFYGWIHCVQLFRPAMDVLHPGIPEFREWRQFARLLRRNLCAMPSYGKGHHDSPSDKQLGHSCSAQQDRSGPERIA